MSGTERNTEGTAAYRTSRRVPATDSASISRKFAKIALADICASRDYCGPANAHRQHGGRELTCLCIGKP